MPFLRLTSHICSISALFRSRLNGACTMASNFAIPTLDRAPQNSAYAPPYSASQCYAVPPRISAMLIDAFAKRLHSTPKRIASIQVCSRLCPCLTFLFIAPAKQPCVFLFLSYAVLCQAFFFAEHSCTTPSLCETLLFTSLPLQLISFPRLFYAMQSHASAVLYSSMPRRISSLPSQYNTVLILCHAILHRALPLRFHSYAPPLIAFPRQIVAILCFA